MPVYDAVVIGAGNGGLTAAAYLAQKGLKILLLERHNIPGGCATSFCRGRFEFEVALHQLSGLGTEDKPGPLRKFFYELGIADELEWVAMENFYRLIVPGELDITLKAERKEQIAALQERFPSEKQAIQEFFDMVYRFYNEMLGFHFSKEADSSKGKYSLYMEYVLKNAQEVLDKYFQDPLLKLAVSVYWPYSGLPPAHMPFADLAALLFSYIEFKPYHLKGGSQALSSALLNRFQDNGGEARFSCGAKKIVVEDGQIKGVITESGDLIESSYVISNASTLDTYVEMIDHEELPEELFKILGGSTIGPSSLTIYIGLDCEAADIGITEATNFICSSADTNDAFSCFKNIETKDDTLLVSCYDLVDPSFSPPGCSQVVIVDLKYAEPWINIPPSRYYQTKYQAADIVLERVEKLFPGLREHIEEIEVATPITHMRFLGHPGGAIYGFDQYIKESKFFVSPQSPVKGLYFAGSWAGSGGFQPTLMSGGAAARALLRELKQRGKRDE